MTALAFHEDGRWLNRTFECDCGATWHDEWSCDCDDDCPACGATVAPLDSADATAWAVGQWGLPPLGLAADVPDAIGGPRRGS